MPLRTGIPGQGPHLALKLLNPEGDMRNRRHAFSYIELMITMVIACMLYMAMCGPNSPAGRAKRRAQCARQLEQMHSVLALYAAEHDGVFPAVEGASSSEAPLSQLVPLYTTDTSIFICPASGHSALPGAQPFADRRISYAYVTGLKRDADPGVLLVSDAQVNTLPKTQNEPLFSTSGSAPGNNHRTAGGNMLFVDGHVETPGALAPRALPVPEGATLLNPRP
jgi:prepilin-type processing-associated H-X9-DG protein